jgi:glycosyltransferase involved in cell wall biosynthesis
MKILWIVNTIFPAPSEAMGLSAPVFGGWMYGLSEQLSNSLGIELAVATTYVGYEFKTMSIDRVTYFLLPCKNNRTYESRLEPMWELVCNKFYPDIVHIHGTEFTQGLSCMRKLPSLRYIISIQGLLSVCAEYYYAGMSFRDVIKNITFRDLVKGDTLFQARKKFEERGLFELEYIERTKHVIGRTKWDFAHIKALNPKVNYHFCNESLRNSFYFAKKWSLNNCNPYTIFLSQAGYPVKGLHQVIRAVSIVKIEYPDLKIRLAGPNITRRQSIKDKLKFSGYGKYLRKLLIKHNLENNVYFLGMLSEEQMITEYQKAHVFICPSSIENSPNSLGEAQIIGVPSIAAYVGGIPDMIENGETGLLYRFEEVEMLAENIRSIFRDNYLARKLAETGIEAAELRHNREINLKRMLEIYTSIY